MSILEKVVMGLLVLLILGGVIAIQITLTDRSQKRNDLMMRYCIEAGGDPIDCACDAYHGGICGYAVSE